MILKTFFREAPGITNLLCSRDTIASFELQHLQFLSNIPLEAGGISLARWASVLHVQGYSYFSGLTEILIQGGMGGFEAQH